MKPCISRFAPTERSRAGRVVIQAALASAQSRAFEQLVGVELSLSRLEQSEVVLQALREQVGLDAGLAEALSRVTLAEEDATCTGWLDKATHVFMCSTAFGATACRRYGVQWPALCLI